MSAPLEYYIVEARSREELIIAVNNHIRDGWRPQGGVACNGEEDIPLYFYQALIKEGKQ